MIHDTIIIVDDDRPSAEALSLILGMKYQVKTFYSPEDFLEYTRGGGGILAVIADYKMPRMNGIDMFKMASPNCTIQLKIIITGIYDIDIAVNAVNQIHANFIFLKPFDVRELLSVLEKEKAKRKKDCHVTLTADEIFALTKGMDQIKAGY